jgi:hypothetical protein
VLPIIGVARATSPHPDARSRRRESRPISKCCKRCPRNKARTDARGEASLRGHLKAQGEEQTGSQSYIPPDPKDDKALHTALDLIAGSRRTRLTRRIRRLSYPIRNGGRHRPGGACGRPPPRIDVSRIPPWLLVAVNGFLALVGLVALIGIWSGRTPGVST